jgi:hypothetical protein
LTYLKGGLKLYDFSQYLRLTTLLEESIRGLRDFGSHSILFIYWFLPRRFVAHAVDVGPNGKIVTERYIEENIEERDGNLRQHCLVSFQEGFRRTAINL